MVVAADSKVKLERLITLFTDLHRMCQILREWQKQNLKIWKEHIMIYFFARKFAIAGYETRFIGEKD